MERYNGKKKPRQQADKKTSRSVQTGRMTEEERQRERRRRRRALQRKRERQRRLILGIMAIGILFVTAAAAFESGFHLLVFIALINTILSLYYYLKIVKAMYINKSDEPIATFRSDNYTRASLAICTLGIVALSIASVVYQSIDKFSFGM